MSLCSYFNFTIGECVYVWFIMCFVSDAPLTTSHFESFIGSAGQLFYCVSKDRATNQPFACKDPTSDRGKSYFNLS
jgi:hypothetical protein